MPIARVERYGNIAFTNGKKNMVVPSEDTCRERLIKLLEDAGGNCQASVVTRFWMEAARECGDMDEMKRAWATETFKRLEKVWDELITPPPVDVFAAFGITED